MFMTLQMASVLKPLIIVSPMVCDKLSKIKILKVRKLMSITWKMII